MTYDNTNPDDPLLVTAQPAPGRWHWWVTPDLIYPCCCTDAKHLYAAPEPDYLNALEAERDQLKQLVELKEGNTRAQQARADDYLKRMGELRAERDALREKAAAADKARAFMANRTIGGDAYHFWTVWFADYEALDAAQKAPK